MVLSSTNVGACKLFNGLQSVSRTEEVHDKSPLGTSNDPSHLNEDNRCTQIPPTASAGQCDHPSAGELSSSDLPVSVCTKQFLSAAMTASVRSPAFVISNQTPTSPSGSPSGAVLSHEDVITIFLKRPDRAVDRDGKNTFQATNSETATQLGLRYKVASKTIRDIWNRNTWVNVSRPFWNDAERVAAGDHVPGADVQGILAAQRRKRGRPRGAKDSVRRVRTCKQPVKTEYDIEDVLISEKKVSAISIDSEAKVPVCTDAPSPNCTTPPLVSSSHREARVHRPPPLMLMNSGSEPPVDYEWPSPSNGGGVDAQAELSQIRFPESSSSLDPPRAFQEDCVPIGVKDFPLASSAGSSFNWPVAQWDAFESTPEEEVSASIAMTDDPFAGDWESTGF
mmetsp:Transcript_27270/g.55701  ORF Transcript_27270/g.55701 Transcript_27270/m.55701 type:complete len:394 (-) Transcript_27270:118-1299(-)